MTTIKWSSLSVYLIALFAVALTGLGSCSKGDEVSGAEMTRELLTAGSWSMQSLTVDGTDESALFADLTVTFSNTGFTATNGEPVWPVSGTWNFDDDSGKSFTRADGIVVAIDNIEATAMQLSLTWEATTLGPGRTKSVRGIHVFVFGR